MSPNPTLWHFHPIFLRCLSYVCIFNGGLARTMSLSFRNWRHTSPYPIPPCLHAPFIPPYSPIPTLVRPNNSFSIVMVVRSSQFWMDKSFPDGHRQFLSFFWAIWSNIKQIFWIFFCKNIFKLTAPPLSGKFLLIGSLTQANTSASFGFFRELFPKFFVAENESNQWKGTVGACC